MFIKIFLSENEFLNKKNDKTWILSHHDMLFICLFIFLKKIYSKEQVICTLEIKKNEMVYAWVYTKRLVSTLCFKSPGAVVIQACTCAYVYFILFEFLYIVFFFTFYFIFYRVLNFLDFFILCFICLKINFILMIQVILW